MVACMHARRAGEMRTSARIRGASVLYTLDVHPGYARLTNRFAGGVCRHDARLPGATVTHIACFTSRLRTHLACQNLSSARLCSAPLCQLPRTGRVFDVICSIALRACLRARACVPSSQFSSMHLESESPPSESSRLHAFSLRFVLLPLMRSLFTDPPQYLLIPHRRVQISRCSQQSVPASPCSLSSLSVRRTFLVSCRSQIATNSFKASILKFYAATPSLIFFSMRPPAPMNE
eukprot:6178086-Pleurochrysis_carterae.AAC.2